MNSSSSSTNVIDRVFTAVRGLIPGRASARKSFQDAKSYSVMQRWKAIQQNLGDDDESLLDIGCDSGALTELAAGSGLFAVGVDQFDSELFGPAEQEARERSANRKNLGIIKLHLCPETITQIPTFDVVLLLGIYHYWHCEFGGTVAQEMLQSLRGSGRVFFSASSREARYESLILRYGSPSVSIPELGDSREDIVRHYSHLLENTLGNEYRVQRVCSVEYNYETRHMLLAEKGKKYL